MMAYEKLENKQNENDRNFLKIYMLGFMAFQTSLGYFLSNSVIFSLDGEKIIWFQITILI